MKRVCSYMLLSSNSLFLSIGLRTHSSESGAKRVRIGRRKEDSKKGWFLQREKKRVIDRMS